MSSRPEGSMFILYTIYTINISDLTTWPFPDSPSKERKLPWSSTTFVLLAKWSILGTTNHRIVPNDRASRFLHWRRKWKLKPLMLAVSLALMHSVGSFTGIYSEKTLCKSAIVFGRIPPSVESAKDCKGTKDPSGCWWEMMHGARCTPDVLGQRIEIWCDPF